MNVAKNWALTIMLIALTFRSFLERTVVERANDYPCYKNVHRRWSYRRKIDRFLPNLPEKSQRNRPIFPRICP